MGVRTFEDRREEPPPPRGPGPAAAAAVALVVFVLLLANGRPIGAGDPRGLVRLLEAPLRALAGAFVEPDGTAQALAGKLAASIFAALAAAFLFVAVGRRRPTGDALTAALLLAFGSSLWAASQSLSADSLAAAAMALAVLRLVQAEDEPGGAGRAGLPLSLAVAVQPATAAAALVLAGAVVLRWPRRTLSLVLWSLPGLLLLAAQAAGGFPATLAFDPLRAPGPEGLAALASPARGALVFTPLAFVAAIGLVRGWRYDRWLSGTLGLAVLAHGVLILCLPDPGSSWGALGSTAIGPLLFFFLPQGLDASRLLGVAVAVVSVAIQALGAFAYDGRWDRLHRDAAGRITSAWDVAESPVAFQLRERVLHFAVPMMADRRVFLREHLMVVGGPEGSRVAFAGDRPLVSGAESTLGDVAFLGVARVAQGKLELRAAGDGLFLRVPEGARPRRLELRIAGSGRGALDVSEGSFWNLAPRTVSQAVTGDFRVRHPYVYAESGGGDLRVTLRSGSLDLRSIALVPPGEPENVIRLQGEP
jgi:hypothetical protein